MLGATPLTYRETSGGITQTASAIDAPATIPLTPMQRKVLSGLPQNEKRARLVASVLDAGVLAPRDFKKSTAPEQWEPIAG